MNQQKIQPDPAQLAARLNQPPMTRAEMLKQVQDTMPLHPSAARELAQSSSDSGTGPSKTEN